MLRGHETRKVTVKLGPSPRLPREMKKYDDETFEFRVRDVSPVDRERAGWPESGGVLVESVTEGGWAALGHLAEGDLILAIDGEKVSRCRPRCSRRWPGLRPPSQHPSFFPFGVESGRSSSRCKPRGRSNRREGGSMTSRIRHLLVLVLLLAAVSRASAQNENRAAARDIVRKWQDAIVNVRVTLKLRMSMAGREMNASDDSADTVGTVIDPSGLTVVSLGAINPGATMNKIMGAASQGGQDRPTLSSEPTEVKIRVADGRELTAKIVLRDEDLDLAFLMPTAKLDKPLVAINLQDASRPALLDEVIVLSRLGRVGAWTPSALLQNVTAIIDKPRTFFVTEASGGGTPMGTPAFLPNGKVVGVLTLRSVDPGGAGMLSMMGSTEGLGLLAVILPAADVLEVAKQATEK